ncbi:uncharacterized protein LOC132193380 isoform X2 [Neocloeon triangulifer]|uniref:uncharacterized protein LOC132193380 isoform X2 n=1 Tax=Neocloeon triangulifer TaxID=2078957 RepID=UPI00286ECADD|nr:uncharacterized protein LOC132193380 isoform X2 [Neocloeon triangulifer]
MMMQGIPFMQVLEYRLPAGMHPLVEDPSLQHLHQLAAAGGATVAQVVQAPALPAPNAAAATTATYQPTTRTHQCWSSALRKYVILCTACGGMAALLGALFLLVHFVLRAHTSSLHYFETVPTYVPATMLTLTGLAVMGFARRKNRYSYLIKVCGICCLLSAVLCVIVTVTTTVIHMNRLQTLRECVYTQKNQACTCYSGLTQDPSVTSEESMRFVFHNTPDCEVVHGALYSCLRALFGLSVIGILVCIFSCMLVYQLLSHEKKKMYWEQLEMRCRYLYGRRPVSGQHQYTYCGCSCDDCPRAAAVSNSTIAPHTEVFQPWPAWQWDAAEERYWTPPRIGNLYTPNPEDQVVQQQQQQSQEENAVTNARWSWLPWNRSSMHVQETPEVEQQRPLRTDQDSQYGFGVTTRPTTTTATIIQTPRGHLTSTVVRPLTAQAFMTDASSSLPRYMWGPPPPYSHPPSTAGNSTATSPSRQAPALPQLDQQQHSSLCQRHTHVVHQGLATPTMLHHHHHHCEQQTSTPASPQNHPVSPLQSPVITARQHSTHTSSPYCARLRAENVQAIKSLADLPPPVTSAAGSLPSRKLKKKPADAQISKVDSQESELSSAISPTDSPSRKGLASSLRGLFGNMPGSPVLVHPTTRSLTQSAPTSAINSPLKAASIPTLRRHCVEAAMKSSSTEPAESELYFADVSSCNGGPESSLYDEPSTTPEQPPSHYSSIPSPPPPRGRPFNERLAPDAQYEPRQGGAEDDAPLRGDSDATIDSGVHSGSEAALQSRLRPTGLRSVEQLMTTRSVNV